MRTSRPYVYRGARTIAAEEAAEAERATREEWARYMKANARANKAYPKLRDTVDIRYSITLEERQP